MKKILATVLMSMVATSLFELPAVAAGDNPFWGKDSITYHAQITTMWPKANTKQSGSLCSGTVISDRHIITAAHCFNTPIREISGDTVIVTKDENPVTACLTPDACYKNTESHLYRHGDVAIVIFPEGSFIGKPQAEFGIQTPQQPQGMELKVCGRNQVSNTAKPLPNSRSMSCTTKLPSAFFSMRQDHTWPGNMHSSATIEHWGTYPSVSLIRKYKSMVMPEYATEKDANKWAVHVHVKADYYKQISGGDSGGGWFSLDSNNKERLVAISSFVGRVDWDTEKTNVPTFFGAGGVLLEGKILEWINIQVSGEETFFDPPEVFYSTDLENSKIHNKLGDIKPLSDYFELRLRKAYPELFPDNDESELKDIPDITQDNTQHSPENRSELNQDEGFIINPPHQNEGTGGSLQNSDSALPPIQNPSSPSVPIVPKPKPIAPAPAPQPAPTPSATPLPTDSPEHPGEPEQTPKPELRLLAKPGPSFTQLQDSLSEVPFFERFTKPVEDVTIDRIAGSNRVETSTKIFEKAGNKDVAVLSTGAAYADGLAGGSLAGALNTGVLLTTRKGDEALEAQVVEQLKANGTKTVYIIGGPNAIGSGVEQSLKAHNITVKRLAGQNRFETAELIASTVEQLRKKKGPVLVASGSRFPDALVASAAAARLGGTVRLVDEAHPYTGEGYCIGGPACAHAPNAEKIVGKDRYETAYQLAARLPFSGKVIAVSGNNFPDALAAGAFSAAEGATMVLTDGDQVGVPQGTKDVTVIGGESVIKPTVSVRH